MSNRLKRKGKSKFIMLDGYLIRSAAWKSLSPIDRAIYLEMKWAYDGFNNGRIGMGCRELASAVHVSKDTANRSLENLQTKGFIAKTKLSGFNVKNRVATEWRLAEYNCDVTGELGTKEFTRWRPEEKNTVSCQGQTVSSQGQWKPKTGVKYG